MTAPVAASGRVPMVEWQRNPGIDGWEFDLHDAEARFGTYRLRTWLSDRSCTWWWTVDGVTSSAKGIEPTPDETRAQTALRVRILAEQALEAHLVEALAALRGTA